MQVKLLLSGIIAIVVASCVSLQKGTVSKQVLLEIKDKTLIPEGIAVHPKSGQVYLSSLHHNKIVSVDSRGGVTDVISGGQDGFMWGLGMKFSPDGKVLWACSADGKGSTALFAIDPQTHRVIMRYTHDSARFFNDLVIMNNGQIYLTDTERGAVFLWQNDSIQLFIRDEKLTWANGIASTPAGEVLVVASGRYGLQTIDITTRNITSTTQGKRTDYAIDGLVWHNNTIYAAIGWPQDSLHQHRILQYHFNGDRQYIRTDTLSSNQYWLQTPTTLAVHNNRLFALSLTNLGMYNRHQQKTEKIMDSLRLPLVAVFPLPK